MVSCGDSTLQRGLDFIGKGSINDSNESLMVIDIYEMVFLTSKVET